MSNRQDKGRKTRKYGRAARKPKTARYNNENRRFKNKLKRVRQSSGEAAAKKYERGKDG